MSNPRASIQRVVAAPPAPSSLAAATVVIDRPVEAAQSTATERPIGKAHGRMRCVNVGLSTESATRLRQAAAQQGLTLGEMLMDFVRAADVPLRTLRDGRQPTSRRHVTTTNVYVLLTEAEAADLRELAACAGRTVSDYVDLAISGPAGHASV